MEKLFNYTDIKFIFLFSIKDLFRSKAKLLSISITLFLSLFIYSTILTINLSLNEELSKNQKTLLGGDLEIDYNRGKADYNLISKIRKIAQVTEIIEFNSMINKDKNSIFVRIKSIDINYPLYGKVETHPKNAFQIMKKNSNTILLNKNTFENLKLKIGEKVNIQNKNLTVIGYLKNIPDIGGAFVFGDYAMINNITLDELKLQALGNLINKEFKLKFNKNIETKNGIKLVKNILNKDKNHKIKMPENSGRGLKLAINNFIQFLSLLSISALLIASVGLANSLLSYLNDKYISIAIKKAIGMKNSKIKLIYYCELFFLLIISSLFSYILSLFIIPILNSFLINFYNIQLSYHFSLFTYLNVFFAGFVVFVIFSIPTLNAIDSIKGNDLLKNVKRDITFIFKTKTNSLLFLTSLIFVLFISLSSFRPIYSLIYFISFFICILIFYLIFIIFLRQFKKIYIENFISFKFALKDIIKFKNISLIVLVTLGLGTTLLLSLGLIGFNLKKEISKSIPNLAPDYFFIGLQNNQKLEFINFIKNKDSLAVINAMPMVSVKLIKINNIDPLNYIDRFNESFWFINNDRRISWSDNPPLNNPITKGKWWENNQNEEELLISLDSKIAKDLNVKLDDKFTLLISGREVIGKVVNFRKVNYRDLNINFAMLINPSFAKKLPSEILATVKFDKEVKNINLLNEFPNVSFIEVRSYLQKISNLLNKIYLSISLVSLVVIFIGFFVIVSAIIVQGKSKIYQNLVFKIIGLSKLQIIKSSIIEFLILYGVTIFFSTIFSIIISNLAIQGFFNLSWEFDFNTFFIIISFIIVLSLLLIFFTNFKYLTPKIYPLIRNE
jgi:putative ABC transport system permease protein